MIVRQGDIYYANIGEGVGCEQSGIRPVLVLSNDLGNKFSNTVIVACMTRNTKGFVTHLIVEGSKCGLQYDSAIQLEQIRTLDKIRLGRKAGHVPPEIMEKVFEILEVSFGWVTKKEAKEVRKLTIIENGLIPVYESEKTNAKAVSARELYKGLELAVGQFSRWASVNIIESGFFAENVDFYRVRLEVEGNEVDDYIMKLDMAKHLVMLARTEKAHLVRDYFIRVEEKYRQQNQIKVPQTFAEALRLAADLEEEKQRLLSENTAMKPKAESFDVFMGATGNLKINEVAKTLNIKDVGQNNMFKLLLKEKIIFKEGSGKDAYYLPKQEHESHFVVKQNPVHKGDMVMQRSQIFLTPEGLDWLAKKLIKKGYQVNYGKAKQMSLSN
jgi:mRNA interferase MazF